MTSNIPVPPLIQGSNAFNTLEVSTLKVDTEILGAAITTLDKQSVTQITSITTGVTINGASGSIVTVSATTAALGASEFTVTNSFVTADSNVFVQIKNYTGTYTTNGLPSVNVQTVAAGSFNVVITNAHNANALNGVLTLEFIVS